MNIEIIEHDQYGYVTAGAVESLRVLDDADAAAEVLSSVAGGHHHPARSLSYDVHVTVRAYFDLAEGLVNSRMSNVLAQHGPADSVVEVMRAKAELTALEETLQMYADRVRAQVARLGLTRTDLSFVDQLDPAKVRQAEAADLKAAEAARAKVWAAAATEDVA
jgi:hypothetical protein